MVVEEFEGFIDELLLGRLGEVEAEEAVACKGIACVGFLVEWADEDEVGVGGELVGGLLEAELAGGGDELVGLGFGLFVGRESAGVIAYAGKDFGDGRGVGRIGVGEAEVVDVLGVVEGLGGLPERERLNVLVFQGLSLIVIQERVGGGHRVSGEGGVRGGHDRRTDARAVGTGGLDRLKVLAGEPLVGSTVGSGEDVEGLAGVLFLGVEWAGVELVVIELGVFAACAVKVFDVLGDFLHVLVGVVRDAEG